MKYSKGMTFLCGFLLGAYFIGEYSGKLYKKQQRNIAQLFEDKMFLSDWLEMKENGRSMDYYISQMGYKEIAIYGMGVLGKRLLDELLNSEICVKYAIDKNVSSDMVEIKRPTDKLEKVDAIIVTAIPFYDEIYDEMSKNVNFPIVSLKSFLAPEYIGCN